MASSPATTCLKRSVGEVVESGGEGEPRKNPKTEMDTDFQPRHYQKIVVEVAMQRNTIVVLETGSGKTMIAVMLMEKLMKDIMLSSEKRLIVFLAPTVHLVSQQFEYIKTRTNIISGLYYGARGVDSWNAKCWEREMSEQQIIVMTPKILLDALRNAFLSFDMIHLLIFDECHHATGHHPYAKIMKEFYHRSVHKPHIFGMTASPVIRKGVSSAADCEDQISELESVLDSKIYTVSDRTELELFVPLAKEVNRYYGPNLDIHGDIKRKLETLWVKFGASVPLQESPLNQSSETNDILKTSRERLSKDHGKIFHCLEDLGLFCASEAAKICMENACGPYSMECDFSGASLVSYGSFLTEVLHTIEEAFPNGHEAVLTTQCGFLEAVRRGYISPKLYELVRIFQLFGESKKVLCLIFVERIITAIVIKRFLRKLSCLSHLKVSYLTGGSTSVDAQTPKMQKDTLDLFHSGKVNLLLCTDVAEEGIHVSNCSCVIHFDLPKTVRSYVQSSGRARQADSHFIIMLERGNVQQKDILFDIIRSKQSMMNTALNRDPETCISKVYCKEKINAYSVESTGATVTEDSSINVIYRYCDKLPRDKYFTPRPTFQLSLHDRFYECTLTLPPNAPFQTLVGPVHRNSHVAKQLVCLDACKKLHQIGAINDHLLPFIEKPLEGDHIEENEQSASGAGTTKRKELHGTTAARALSGTWALTQDGVTLQAYRISFSCVPVGQIYSDFVLLIDTILDDDVSYAEVDLYLVDKMVKSSLSPCGPVHLDAEQVKQSKLFQEFFFNGLFGKLFTGSRATGLPRKFILDAENELSWRTSNMYLLLPLDSSRVQTKNNLRIYWKGISACTSVVEYMKNRYLLGCNSSPKVAPLAWAPKGSLFGAKCSSLSSTNLMTTECKNFDTIHLANKAVQFHELKDMVVIAVHTGRIYSVLDLLLGTSADSPFDGASDKGSSDFTTFSNYYNKKYEIVLQHPGQPLLLLKHSHNPHNLLFSKLKNEGDVPVKKPLSHASMPPELLIHVDVPLDVLRSFYLLPSLMHRLESLMLACQLRAEIASPSSCRISASLILEAITTLRCCENFSLERLELLGDSILKYGMSCKLFLKFPQKDEGQLSAYRSRAVCNATLYKLGTNHNLQGYIRDAAFDPRRWVAPGQASLRPDPCNCGVDSVKSPLKVMHETENKSFVIVKTCDSGHRWMCSKTIADCVEALIGAYYIGGGMGAALSLMKWFGLDAEFEPMLVDEAIRAASMLCYLSKVDEIQLLESKINYKFSVKGLLLEAITHGSEQELGACYCYQRLEFLGDSVLDLLITCHHFKCHSDIDPGELTDLRSASVNNESFAQVAVRHKLHQHLQHNSGLLTGQIADYLQSVEEKSSESKETLLANGSKVPKALGDIVESIAGAILIDTKLNLENVWEIFEPLLSPIVTPDTLDLPPLRELNELCSHLGYFINANYIIKGEMVIVELAVQLEDVQLVRQGCDRSRKAAKGQAAYLLLKDMEEKGHSHRRYASKRQGHDLKSTDDACNVSTNVPKDYECVERIYSKRQKVGLSADLCALKECQDLDESKKNDGSKLSGPAFLNVKKKKGGPRTALYELCKKAHWPMPTFVSTALESSRTERKCSSNQFESKITLHIPNCRVVELVGEGRDDKKSSQDSAALAMLYELQEQGRCFIHIIEDDTVR